LDIDRWRPLAEAVHLGPLRACRAAEVRVQSL
jgi:hypothetical protein